MTQQPQIPKELSHSTALCARAKRIFAGSTTHDSWNTPAVFRAFESATGPWKISADGRRYVDLWMGHGALLLGHAYPEVMESIRAQLMRGTHFAGPDEMQVQWAELVSTLVPCAEQIRFASSGTEAAMLACRVARAYTGRACIMRLDGHFHGWHDEGLAQLMPAAQTGLNPGTAEFVYLCSEDDCHHIADVLQTGDVAAVMLEPGGGSSGTLAMRPSLLRDLKRLTSETNTLLIFDESVSGFRYAPGGVQSIADVTPDLTILSKILCGGLPGAAVVGKRKYMEVFGEGFVTSGGCVRISHTGTFNGNPVSASAGLTTLRAVADGTPGAIAEGAAQRLVSAVNEVAQHLSVDVALFRQSSIVHVIIGARAANVPVAASCEALAQYKLNRSLYDELQAALFRSGADMHSMHAWISAAHDDVAIETACDAFRQAIRELSPLLARYGYA